MRFLIYGAGVIGSIFAGRLAAAGHDVTVLARGRRAEEVWQKGIILFVPGKRKEERIPVKVTETLEPEDEYDYIIVAMQRTQVESVLPVLSQNRSENIVFVVNTAGGYEKWAEAVGSRRLMIGFPSAGGERINGRVNYFIGKGMMRAFQTTTFGEYNGMRTQRVLRLISAFNRSGIPSVFCPDMDAWQKTHVAMVTSIANALYRFDCNNYDLARSPGDVKLMIRGIKEGFSVIKRLGVKPTPRKLWYFKLPAWLTGGVFRIVMGTKLAEIAMAKHCIAARPELKCLQSEFDALISQSGMKTPAIDMLKAQIII